MPQPLAALVASACLVLVLACGCHAPFRSPAEPFGSPAQRSQAQLLQSPQLLVPSNHRNWKGDLAVLPHAETRGNRVTVHNIRSFVYESDEDYVVNYYDKTFDLRQLQTVDFITVPFQRAPSLAHTMLSFGFSMKTPCSWGPLT